MSMSDCVKCWDTPCTCGHEYKDWKTDRLIAMRDVLQNIIDDRPDADVDDKSRGINND